MVPPDVPGLVIDSLDHSRAPNVVIRPSPAIDPIGWLGKINAPTRMGTHNEQAGFCVEAGRTVIGHATLVGRNEAAIGGWFLRRIRNGPALFIYSECPVHWTEWNGEQTLSIGAIEHKEIAVTRSLHQHFARLAMEVSIHQHGRLDCVPIVRIVGRGLE